MNETLRVLLVEDNRGDARLICEYLREAHRTNFQVTTATSFKEASELLGNDTYDVALVDLSLPDSHGLETVSALNEVAPHLPIVVNSGLADESVAVESLNRGAQDYLFKGRSDGDLISRALRYAIERKRTSERLTYLAHYDQLTGLANRLLFHERLESALSRSRRSDSNVALLFIDLDRFKEVNDVLGHESGDRLLQAVARQLKKSVRECDTVSRLGGDEFTVVVEDLVDPRDAAIVASNIEASLSQPLQAGEQRLQAGASIGIATYPKDGQNVDELLRAADAALYSAKDEGRNCFRFFDARVSDRATNRSDTVRTLQAAYDEQQFSLVYQPQVDPHSLRTLVMEALLRWHDPEGNEIPPARFIAQLEESGLIVQVGEWALRKACSDCAQWRKSGIPHARVAVNISPRQLRQSDFVAVLEAACTDAKLPVSALDLEVTEDVLGIDNEDSVTRLRSARELGARICIDDFGTGYTSIGRLAELPLDAIKVHQSFVQSLQGDGKDAVFGALVALGKKMRLAVVAEGVEESQQLSRVKSENITAQGFEICRPMAASDVVSVWKDGLHNEAPRKRSASGH